MAGEIKKLKRSEGVTVGAPSDLNIGGGTGINYIVLSDGAAYNDGAVDTPIDGTGGTANITGAINTTNPLIGSQDFKISKDDSDRQGEGVSWDFEIDKIYADSPILMKTKIHFQGTTNFDPNDIVIYIYDKDEPVLIQPSSYQLNALQGVFETVWQPNAGNTNYRVILHIASTNALAWDLQVEIETGPQSKVTGPAMTDVYVPSTDPVFTYGTNAATNYSVSGTIMKRFGEILSFETRIDFDGAANANGDFRLKLPDNLQLDVNKLIDGQKLGSAYFDSTTALYDGDVLRSGSSTTEIEIYRRDDNGANRDEWHGNTVAGNNIPTGAAIINGAKLVIKASVPILGWSSNTQMSNEGETRVVAARYYSDDGDTYNGSEQVLDYEEKDFDTHGIVTVGASWKAVAPIAGIYKVYLKINKPNTSNVAAGDLLVVGVKLNGTVHSYVDSWEAVDAENNVDVSVGGTTLIKMNAGDYITPFITEAMGAGTVTLSAVGAANYICIERISGPSAIAASEVVALNAYGTTAININTPQWIQFTTTEIDTHGSHSSNAGGTGDGDGSIFTSPISGLYLVNTNIYIGNTSNWASGDDGRVLIIKNLTTELSRVFNIFESAHTNNTTISSTIIVGLDAGDTIKIKAQSSSATARSENDGHSTTLSIHRIGGVM